MSTKAKAGRKGGKSRSKKKLQAIAANLAKARSKRWAPPAGGKTIHEAYAEQVAAGLTRVKETK
jgi:hypothetical protein